MSDPSLINNPHIEKPGSAQPATPAELLAARPWLRSYEDGVAADLDIPDRPLSWLLDNTASRYPSHTAIIYYGTQLTYAQLSNQANRFAIELQRLGVTKGDRVAVALPNIPQYPIAFFGAIKAGAVVVPTNPRYTKHEMQHQMADSGAKVLIMLDDFYPLVREIRGETQLEHIIVTSPADYLPPLLRTLYPLSQRNVKKPMPPLTKKELQEDSMLHSMHDLLDSHKLHS